MTKAILVFLVVLYGCSGDGFSSADPVSVGGAGGEVAAAGAAQAGSGQAGASQAGSGQASGGEITNGGAPTVDAGVADAGEVVASDGGMANEADGSAPLEGDAGAGGSGGSSGLTCQNFPSRDKWTASGFPVNAVDPASNAIDNNPDTRWMTLEPTQGGEWVSVDFSEDVELSAIVLRTLFEQGEGYMVFLDGEAITLGSGPTSADGLHVIHLGNVYRGRVLRVMQTGSAPGSYWSVYDIGPYCP